MSSVKSSYTSLKANKHVLKSHKTPRVPKRTKSLLGIFVVANNMLHVSLFQTNEVENEQASGAPEPNPAIPTNTSILIFSVSFRKFRQTQKVCGESFTNKTGEIVCICIFIREALYKYCVVYMHLTEIHIFSFTL